MAPTGPKTLGLQFCESKSVKAENYECMNVASSAMAAGKVTVAETI